MSKLKQTGFSMYKYVSTHRAGLPYSVFFLYFSTTCLSIIYWCHSLPSFISVFVPFFDCRSCRKRRTAHLFSWTRALGVCLSWRRRKRPQTRVSNAPKDYQMTLKVTDLKFIENQLRLHVQLFVQFFYFDFLFTCQLNQRGRWRS